jgi:cobalt-zinc-cadmium resistance protein CzcA
MLNKIIEYSVKNKLIIGLFTLSLILFGIYETTRLPIDAQPDITNNQVQIITVAPSFGASDIERLVTFPIEQANSNITGIEEIRSFSRFGLSLVTIVFDDETDVYWARQQVAERLQKVQSQIPNGIGMPELGPISTGLGEIYQYVVRPKKGYEHKYNETELRTIQDWIVRRQLLGVKGVADVSSFGGKLKQYEIAINPQQLQAYNLTINDVFDALEKNNQNTGGAYIEKGPTVLFIRSEGLIGSVEDIENITVKGASTQTPVFIRDVAKVETGYATRYGAMTYNDEGEVSGAIVMMLKGANSNEVIKNVKERIAIIQKTLPKGVVIEPFLDRTKMVNNTISTVKTNLLEGALIVVFILVLFLGNFRAGFLVASVIPLAMLFAIIMMNIFGVGGNLMSLGALDFGLIVDGAVIIVEAVMHQLAHHKKFGLQNKLSADEMDKQVVSSASRMVNSAVFGQIIILIVYLPIFSLSGIEGKMFKPMAQTVAFALVGAFILSLTYIPMMSALFLSKKKKEKANISDRMMVKIESIHQKYLFKALRIPNQIIIFIIILFIGAVFTLSRMGGEFVPSLEEGDFAVETRILPGSNISTTIEYTNRAAKILKDQFPEVEKVVTKIGSGEIPTEPMPMDAGDMIIVLKPKKDWTSATTFPELSEKMSIALHTIPGLSASFQFPVQMRFNELMTGARQDVVAKIFGEDLDSLALYAHKLGVVIQSVKGAQELYIEPIGGMPQVVIDYDRRAIARQQLNISDINRVVNMAFAGQTTGLVFEGERRFDLVVRLDTAKRKNIEDIRNILIPTPSGTQIPLNQLATVDLKNSPNQIQREDAKRRIVVGFNVRGRDVQNIVEELQKKVESKIKLPTGYYITYGGAFENLNKAKDRLAIAVPVSLALIFLLLFFAFRSVKYSLLIYTAIPLSAIGGVYLLALRGMPFSISAGVGFIALFGVAVLNGIVLISEFNRLKSYGIANTTRIVVIGTKVRLRPVLMTALVASLGFLPMAISTGSGAEVQRPLATVVIGGLLLATLLTLFVLPILYIVFEKIKKPKFKHRSLHTKALVLLLPLLLSTSAVFSQMPITIEQAVDTALANSFTIKNSELLVSYQEKLKGSYLDITQTAINTEYGQINSTAKDYRIGASQSIAFPMVYGKRKNMLSQQWNEAVLNQKLTTSTTIKTVSEIFYYILALKKKEKLLIQTDSLYLSYAIKASNRFEKGESNITEKVMADVQRSQIAIQLKDLENDIELASLQFQLLLNTNKAYVPKGQLKASLSSSITFSDHLSKHPELELYQQKIKTAEAEVQLERAKQLPNLSVGYFAQTMKEVNTNSFNGVEFGIGIPFFNKGQRSVIQASKQKVALAENDYAFKNASLTNSYQQLFTAYQNQVQVLNNYEKEQIPAVKTMSGAIKKQLSEGEINYLEWVTLSNQIYQIQMSYVDALIQLNQNIIDLNYYLQAK